MSALSTRRVTTVAAVAALAVTGATVVATHAAASSPDVVISQIYGGGGNSGATYTNDFIELRNAGSAAVDVSGWSVQYASRAGTSWQVTNLTGSIAPGATYLIAQARGSGGTVELPSPKVTGTIAMSASAGKVALVTSSTALVCGTFCSSAPTVRDFVGYGDANDAETAPTPLLSNSTAALRVDGPDTDNNAADFTVDAPDPGDGSTPEPPQKARIADIQGAAHVSPLAGRRVIDVPGVVTAVSGNGFWIQDIQPDNDLATSDAVFVFTSSAPTVVVGNAVTVAGTVSEYRPGNEANNLTTTQIGRASITVTASSAPIPATTVIGPGGRRAPHAVRTDSPGDVESVTAFDPDDNALDFYESMEGMRVRVQDSVAVSPTTQHGEIAVLPGDTGAARTERGGALYRRYTDANAARVIFDDVLAPTPSVNVGAQFPGAVDGVLDYSFGNYKFLVLSTPDTVAGDLPRETTRAQTADELAVATFNVENLSPRDPATKFDRLAGIVVDNLASPDVLTLEEIQDNNGPTNDSVVAADQTYARLIDAIAAAGGPRYEYRQIDPVDDADGGQPGGNIRVAFLFNPARVSFVDRPGGAPTADTSVIDSDGRPVLSASPGRINPTDTTFAASRKPLVGEFEFRGTTVFVIANHFSSKGGDQPLFGRFQPPIRSSESQRHQQAMAVRGFVDAIQAIDRDANIVVLGDINDFQFSETTSILTRRNTMVSLVDRLPADERYSYVYDGNSQVLDQILVNRYLSLPRQFSYDIVHVNSEYADRASDHDPQVVRLRLMR